MKSKIFLNQILLASFVFLFSQIVLAIILYYMGFKYFDSSNWLRADSGHYLSIATKGYELFPCAGKFGFPINSTDICGNTGWFPGYPLLIKLFSYLFKDTVLIAGVLSKLFYFSSLFLVLVIADIRHFSIKNILFLSIAAFSFGFIYYNAIFPISSVLFFALAGLYFYIKKGIWLTALFCFLASFFYPTGFLLSIVFAVCVLFRENLNLNQKISKAFIVTMMGILGVAFVFLVFQITVNDWTAFIQVQSKYGHGLHNPIKSIGLIFPKAFLNTYSVDKLIYYQSLLTISGYLLISLFFFKKRMYKSQLYLFSYVYVSLFLLFPWRQLEVI